MNTTTTFEDVFGITPTEVTEVENTLTAPRPARPAPRHHDTDIFNRASLYTDLLKTPKGTRREDPPRVVFTNTSTDTTVYGEINGIDHQAKRLYINGPGNETVTLDYVPGDTRVLVTKTTPNNHRHENKKFLADEITTTTKYIDYDRSKLVNQIESGDVHPTGARCVPEDAAFHSLVAEECYNTVRFETKSDIDVYGWLPDPPHVDPVLEFDRAYIDRRDKAEVRLEPISEFTVEHLTRGFVLLTLPGRLLVSGEFSLSRAEIQEMAARNW